jgi:hypothetical protein
MPEDNPLTVVDSTSPVLAIQSWNICPPDDARNTLYPRIYSHCNFNGKKTFQEATHIRQKLTVPDPCVEGAVQYKVSDVGAIFRMEVIETGPGAPTSAHKDRAHKLDARIQTKGARTDR